MIPIVTTETLPGYTIVSVLEEPIVAYAISKSFYAASDEVHQVLNGFAKARGASAIIGLRIVPSLVRVVLQLQHTALL